MPSGSGTAADGRKIFAEQCESCHGADLQGGIGDRLIGGRGTLVGNSPEKAPVKTVESYWPYATTLFDYIKRAMPLTAPNSLSNPQVYALCAYILARARIVPDDAVMDAASLAKVRMPNRDGFIPDPRRKSFRLGDTTCRRVQRPCYPQPALLAEKRAGRVVDEAHPPVLPQKHDSCGQQGERSFGVAAALFCTRQASMQVGRALHVRHHALPHRQGVAVESAATPRAHEAHFQRDGALSIDDATQCVEEVLRPKPVRAELGVRKLIVRIQHRRGDGNSWGQRFLHPCPDVQGGEVLRVVVPRLRIEALQHPERRVGQIRRSGRVCEVVEKDATGRCPKALVHRPEKAWPQTRVQRSLVGGTDQATPLGSCKLHTPP